MSDKEFEKKSTEELVATQFKAISWLSKEISEVHRQLTEVSRLFASKENARRYFDRMNLLGDMLNEMDAVEDVPPFVNAAFDQCRAMFPANPKAPQ